jgi:dTDP-4-amino-4,6-dideoxygalactose transaminase
MSRTRIPFMDLRLTEDSADVQAAITRVAASGWYVLGPEVEAFEQEFAGASGAAHAVGTGNGTDALAIILRALGIGPGDEVITPTYSFFATAGCVVRVGAKPVLVDGDNDTFNIDTRAAIAAITPRTKAIIPVHLFGQPAEMAPIMAEAGKRGIPVIEDAAQAIGCTYRGQAIGTIGAVGCFSFFPSKNLGAFGDAGFVTATDDGVAKTLRLLRTHGMEPKYYHHIVGANFRIDAMQAAVLRVKLPHLASWTAGRQKNAARYRALFADAQLADVTLPVEAPERTHIYNQFVIRVPKRDQLRSHLDRQGIGTEVYYPVPFHLQECFANLGYRKGAFPIAEAQAEDSLALPIYPELTEAQQASVVNAIRSFYRG